MSSGREVPGSEMEALVQAYLQDVHYTTRYQSIFNIVYALINAGLLCLPYVASQTGVLIYSVAVVFIGAVSAYSAVIVVHMASDHKVRTIEDLSEKAFNVKGMYITCGLQLVYCISLMCISLSVYADILSDIFKSYYESQGNGKKMPYLLCFQQGQVLLGGLLVLFMCCATRSLVSLRFTSYFTALAVVLSLVAVTGSLISDTYIDSTPNVSMEVIEPDDKWWIFVFIIPFCFSFNQKALTVYSCLRRRTAKRWRFSVVRAMAVVITIYLLFGNAGYIAQHILSRKIDVLDFFLYNKIAGNRTFIDVIRGLVAVSLLLTVPVDCLVASTTLKRLYRRSIRESTLKRSSIAGEGKGSNPNGINSLHYHYTAVNNYTRNDSYLTDTTAETSRDSQKGGFFTRFSSYIFGDKAPKNGKSGFGYNDDYKFDDDFRKKDSKTKIYTDWDYDPDNLMREPYVYNGGNDTKLARGESAVNQPLIKNSIMKDESLERRERGSTNTSESGSLIGSDIRDSEQLFDILDNKGSNERQPLNDVYSTTNNPIYNSNKSNSSNSNSNSPNRVHSSGSTSSPKRAPNIVLPNSGDLNRVDSITSSQGSDRDSFMAIQDKINNESKTSSSGVSLYSSNNAIDSNNDSNPDDDESEEDDDEIPAHYNDENEQEGDVEKEIQEDNLRDSIYSNYSVYGPSVAPSSAMKSRLEKANASIENKGCSSSLSVYDLVPGLLLWLITISYCLLGRKFLGLVCAIGTLCNAALVYLLPSMLYFRLGVLSDFQAIPIYGIIPNRAMMYLVQIMGMILLLCNIAVVIYSLTLKEQIFRDQ